MYFRAICSLRTGQSKLEWYMARSEYQFSANETYGVALYDYNGFVILIKS